MDARHNTKALRDRRRDLRKESTLQEKRLWFYLRGNKLNTKFKRQESIGGYIADFYCRGYKLIIELDGAVHNSKEAKEYDKVRDEYFISLGYFVLRFKNQEIDEDINSVLLQIKNELH